MHGTPVEEEKVGSRADLGVALRKRFAITLLVHSSLPKSLVYTLARFVEVLVCQTSSETIPEPNRLRAKPQQSSRS